MEDAGCRMLGLRRRGSFYFGCFFENRPAASARGFRPRKRPNPSGSTEIQYAPTDCIASNRFLERRSSLCASASLLFYGLSSRVGVEQSGVALRFPPHSKVTGDPFRLAQHPRLAFFVAAAGRRRITAIYGVVVVSLGERDVVEQGFQTSRKRMDRTRPAQWKSGCVCGTRMIRLVPSAATKPKRATGRLWTLDLGL
jgi:hypothetical protein